MGKPERIDVLRDIRHEWRERAKNDLYFLCKAVLGFQDLVPEPHAEMCQFITGPAQWKLFVGSRGILKTSICTIGHGIQLALRDPKARVLIVQGNEDAAFSTLGMIRSLWDSCKALRDLFPERLPTPQMRQAGRWSSKWLQLNTPYVYPDPTFRAAGAGTSLVGTHWTHIKRDDIVSANKDNVTGEVIAPAPEDIEKAIGMHKLTRGILVDPSKSTVDDICNRWCVYDFPRYLMDNEPYLDNKNQGYQCLTMPATDTTGTPIWPQRFSAKALEEIERSQGSFYYATQYKCEPMDSTRSVFKRKDLRFYTEEGGENHVKLPPLDTLRIYAVMDQAQKVALKACFTAVVVVGIDEVNNWWVLDTLRQRINAVDKIDLIFQLADQWNIFAPNTFGIEANLAQNILVEWLDQEQRKRGKTLNIQRLKPPNNISKDARIEALAPYFEQHRVFIRAGGKQDDLVRELTDFPFGKYRDLIDALQYVHRMAVRRNSREASWKPSPWSYEGVMERLKHNNKTASPWDLQDAKVAV